MGDRPQLLGFSAMLTGNNIEDVPYIEKFVSKSHKVLYEKAISAKCELPEDRFEAWSRDLNLPWEKLETPDWTDHFPDCFRWTVSVCLQSFEYLFKLRDLMTNVKLKQMKITADENCPYAKAIWVKLWEWIQNMVEFNC